jgi:hypothetical protein
VLQAEPRLLERDRGAEDGREWRSQVVRDRLEERVLHLVEGAQPAGGLSLALEGVGVLSLALAQGLLRAFALGDVHHEPPHDGDSAARAVYDAEEIPYPDRVAGALEGAVFDARPGCPSDGAPDLRQRAFPVVGVDVIAPTPGLPRGPAEG